MANEPTTTIVSNLVEDPRLAYTPSCVAVANFRVAQTPRQYDRETSQYVDGDPLFMTCNIWRQAAENVANSLSKGDRVIVHGRMRQRSFEDKEGGRRTVMEVEVDAVGPDLRYASAQVSRNPRDGGNFGGNQGGNFGGQQRPQAQQGNGGGYGSHQGNGGQQGSPASQGYQTTQQKREQQGSNFGGSGAVANDDPWNSAPKGQGAFDNEKEPPF